MKTSRVAQISGENKEDCGVWLDTVQLKGRAKKKRSARPISKLLNPLTDGAGYNVAVALNFTQTKMEMPKTKQSSISNFFTGQRRVLHKMATTGNSSTSAQDACFPSAVPFAPYSEDCCDSNNQGSDQLSETEPVMWWEKDDKESPALFQNTNSDFKEESLVVRNPLVRTAENPLPSNNCVEHELKTQSQKSVQKESNFLSFLSQNELNQFGESLHNTERRASIHNTPNRLYLQNNKENTMPISPKKTMPDSQLQTLLKNTKLKPLNEGLNSPIKWTKPNSSPLKKQKYQSFRDNDDESFSMLFTQDSQGFRVMAHRGPQTQSPFEDQSNVSTLVPSGIKCLEEDEDEEEILFTQDSQGNLVIKH